MKRFESFEKLIEEIGVGKTYAEKELNNYLESQGSDVVHNDNSEPECGFDLGVDNKTYMIGVTSIEIDSETGSYKYYYWIME